MMLQHTELQWSVLTQRPISNSFTTTNYFTSTVVVATSKLNLLLRIVEFCDGDAMSTAKAISGMDDDRRRGNNTAAAATTAAAGLAVIDSVRRWSGIFFMIYYAIRQPK